MDNNFNIVLIGAGYWGTNIAKNLVKLKKKFIVYDNNIKKSNIIRKRFPENIIIEKNYDDLIKDKKNLFFIFATPPSKNFNLIKTALKNDKKIFIEKPGFKNVNEIKKIRKIFPNKVKNITFGYIYLFNNHIHYIKKFIKNKNNGKLLYIKFQRQNLGPIRNDVDVSFDLSAHDLSILNYLFKKKLKLINHNSYKILNNTVADISNISFKLDNFYVDINNSWLNPDKIRRIIIITTKKMLLFDEMNINEKIKIYNKYAVYPKIEKLKNIFFSKQAKIYEGKNYSPKITENDPLLDEIKNFLNNKKKKISKFTGINFAQNILEILKKIN
ncbi:Gfo/Idh/MocA family protein [Candidatus Pelagibacter sp. FZCC0015]|uniref:Gfo/Idh/MocA family protein n=1 Tax=Candidatus Pelagibacter sp. FZCC0015 TaxID=2268451 RepID=UPI0011A2DB2D|nr:Gfo/Idh/MocA family oxidoreductase [Candidatus Pelagibacter sp. FZCC0015]